MFVVIPELSVPGSQNTSSGSVDLGWPSAVAASDQRHPVAAGVGLKPAA
jgi:hypothetical protein